MQLAGFCLKYRIIVRNCVVFVGYVMKIVADANIPYVAECLSSIGEVEIVDISENSSAAKLVEGGGIIAGSTVRRKD